MFRRKQYVNAQGIFRTLHVGRCIKNTFKFVVGKYNKRGLPERYGLLQRQMQATLVSLFCSDCSNSKKHIFRVP